MNKQAFLTLISSALLSTSVMATTDSVNTWGPWSAVATAAGPQAQITPFSIRFSDDLNVTDSDQFVTSIETDTGHRFYGTAASYDYAPVKALSIYGNTSYKLLSALELERNPENADMAKLVFTDTSGRVIQHNQFHNVKMNHKSINPDDFSLNFYDSNDKYSNRGYYSIQNMDGYTRAYGSINYPYSHNTWGSVISGTTSNLNAIQGLASNISGTFFSGYFTNLMASANITVDLTNSTWGGKFNIYDQGFGDITVTNAPIKGADLTASTAHMSQQHNVHMIETTQLTSGSVAASFFGSKAQTIAGVVELSGTGDIHTEGGIIKDKRHVAGVFVTSNEPR